MPLGQLGQSTWPYLEDLPLLIPLPPAYNNMSCGLEFGMSRDSGSCGDCQSRRKKGMKKGKGKPHAKGRVEQPSSIAPKYAAVHLHYLRGEGCIVVYGSLWWVVLWCFGDSGSRRNPGCCYVGFLDR
jgi:hypothetical protein